MLRLRFYREAFVELKPVIAFVGLLELKPEMTTVAFELLLVEASIEIGRLRVTVAFEPVFDYSFRHYQNNFITSLLAR